MTQAGQSEPVDPALHAWLQATVRRRFGSERRIEHLARRPSLRQSSYPLEEIDAVLDDGTVVEWMLKSLSRDAVPVEIRHVKPEILYNVDREPFVYRALLGSRELGTAHGYGVYFDRSTGHSALLIERVSGELLHEVGEPNIWQETARWLARMHAAFTDQPMWLADRDKQRLVAYDRTYFFQWIKRAVQVQRKIGDRRAVQVLDEVRRSYGQVVERLAEMPATFIHGEFYPSNIVVKRAADSLRICPVDWEMAGIGPPLIDLAALTSGNWSLKDRAAMIVAYRSERRQVDANGGGDDSLEMDLKYCRLHLAIQWLGWAYPWTPPSEQDHDWLGEATRLCDELRWPS